MIKLKTMLLSKKTDIYLFSLSLFLVICSYLLAIDNDFLGDDIGHIVQNKNLKLGFFKTLTSLTRPFLMATIWVDHFLFGLNPIFFKLTNIFIHTTVGFFFYKLLLLISLGSKNNNYKKIAYVFSLLFLLHPINNQAINIIIQRGLLLSALFMILSLYFFIKHLRTNDRIFLLLSLLFYTISAFSKAGTIVLPLMFIIYEIIIFRKKSFFIKSIPFILVTLLVLVVSNDGNTLFVNPTPVFHYFLTQTKVLFIYFKLMVFPYGFKYLYDVKLTTDILSTYVLLSFVGHLALLASIFGVYKKNKLAALFFIFSYIAFIPTSSFYPINRLVDEHRTYIPLIFILGGLFFLFKDKIQINRKTIFFVFIICFSYIGLNNLRNIEIKPRINWINHTIDNSLDHHSFATYHLLFYLSEKNSDGEKLALKMKSKYPQNSIYSLLYDQFIYPRVDKDKQKVIFERSRDSLSIYTKFLNAETRIEFNNIFKRMVFERYENKLDAFMILCDVLQRQMVIIKKYPKHYKALRELFAKSLVFIIQTLNIKLNELKEEEYSYYFKARVWLYAYFAIDDKKLRSDLINGLRKYPSNDILKQLLKMLTHERIN